MNSDNANAAWLRSLSTESAYKLYKLMVDNAQVYDTVLVEGVELPADFDDYVALDDTIGSYRTGREWRKFASCLVFTEESSGIEWASSNSGVRYARFQFNWKKSADGSWTTPSKRFRGQAPILKRVQDVLTESEWSAFRDAFLPESPDKAAISVKILCHHIAYNHIAKQNPGVYPPLPENLGAGSSISHLCDSACVTTAHLVAAGEHSQNLARQRCPGVVLLCKSGVILQVVDCPHFRRDENGIVAEPNCVRIKVIELAFDPFDSDKRGQFNSKRAEYEAAGYLSQPGMSGGPVPFAE